MLIDAEEFVNENGARMCSEYFGIDKDHISCTVTKPVFDELPDTADMASEENVSGEEIQAQILLNQADIIAKQQEQDEVLAAILLNQMEGGEADV